MERPVNSKVGHGSATCRRYGCNREECLEAYRKYRRENHADRKSGIHSNVSAVRIRSHVQKLLRADMPVKDIARIAGVSTDVLVKVVWGGQGSVRWIIEDAVLGVPVPEYGWNTAEDSLVDPVGAARRLRALALQGFGIASLVHATGLNRRTISEVRGMERHRILISRARKIKEAHDLLWDTDPESIGIAPGDATRARLWAQKQDWMPTEAWADIDDPDCKPVLTTPRYIALTDDAQELIDKQGYTRTTAAERLNITVDTLNAAFSYRNRKAMSDA